MAGYGGGRNWTMKGSAMDESLYRQGPSHHQSYYNHNHHQHHQHQYSHNHPHLHPSPAQHRYQNQNHHHGTAGLGLGHVHGPAPSATAASIAGHGPATSSAAAAAPDLNTSSIGDVVARLKEIAASLGLKGQIQTFGSHISGLSTTSSDCDVTYLPTKDETRDLADPDREKAMLRRFADAMSKNGFRDVVTVLKASLPLVKAIDFESDLEVDLCIGNYLAYRNSLLMAAYCRVDSRVSEVGKLVKQWTKALELVGSSDGHLNSYTFSLLVVHYLICLDPPVLPNLQELEEREHLVPDRRQGVSWDSKFFSDTHLLPRSSNPQSTGYLLREFFEFYTNEFNWETCAVSVRLVRPGCGGRSDPSGRGAVPRTGYRSSAWREVQWYLQATPADQWIIEDPFEMTRNLAAQCSPEGRKRILSLMREAAFRLRSMNFSEIPREWNDIYSKVPIESYYMKCRVHPDKISSSRLAKTLQETSALSAFELRFPTRSREVSDAFIIFPNEHDRRAVYRLNETFAGEWQLRLMYCSKWALEDALRSGDYTSSSIEPVGRPDSSAGGGDSSDATGPASVGAAATATATASEAGATAAVRIGPATATATATAMAKKPTTAAAWIEAPKGTSTAVVVEAESSEATGTQRLSLLLRKQEGEESEEVEEKPVTGSPSASDDGRDDATKVRNALRSATSAPEMQAAIERAEKLGMTHEVVVAQKKLHQWTQQDLESGKQGLAAASRARAAKQLDTLGPATATATATISVAASSGGAASAAALSAPLPAAADTGSTY